MHLCRTKLALAAGIFFMLAVSGILYANAPHILVGAFSSCALDGSLPPDWDPWILKNVGRQSAYSVVEDGQPVVKAESENSASGLMRTIEIDPKKHPILRFSWKVADVIEGADVASKEHNDSPARVYVAFAYDMEKVGVLERIKYKAAKKLYSDKLPLRAISYTWGNKTPKNSIVPMPYTKWFSQIVLENAGSPKNRWITEERDVREDYRKAFGEEPGEITGVAIMTNTDNMGGRAVAWYGDIVFKDK